MSAARSPKRLFYKLRSRYDEVIDHTAVSERRYAERIKCPVCNSPRAEWDDNPVPIDVEVVEEPRGCVAVLYPGGELIREDLYDVLHPHFVGQVVGSVHVVDGEGERRWVPYLTCRVPRPLELEAERGPYCRHGRCRACGRFGNHIGWARGAIVERYIDERRVYLNDLGTIIIEGGLADELGLKERFPDLRLRERMEVISEPLDGDVLPGDPGWDGTFKEQRGIPEPPRGRHRWTLGG